MNRRLLKIKRQLAKPAFLKISDEDFLKKIEKADEILALYVLENVESIEMRDKLVFVVNTEILL